MRWQNYVDSQRVTGFLDGRDTSLKAVRYVECLVMSAEGEAGRSDNEFYRIGPLANVEPMIVVDIRLGNGCLLISFLLHESV
jgi:hypothetical protein